VIRCLADDGHSFRRQKFFVSANRRKFLQQSFPVPVTPLADFPFLATNLQSQAMHIESIHLGSCHQNTCWQGAVVAFGDNALIGRRRRVMRLQRVGY
jgi:hypothetical protein